MKNPMVSKTSLKVAKDVKTLPPDLYGKILAKYGLAGIMLAQILYMDVAKLLLEKAKKGD